MKRLSSFGLLLASGLLASCGGGGGGSSTSSSDTKQTLQPPSAPSAIAPPTSDPEPSPIASGSTLLSADVYRSLRQADLRLAETTFGSVLTTYAFNTAPIKDIDVAVDSSGDFSYIFSVEGLDRKSPPFTFKTPITTNISGYDIRHDVLMDVDRGYFRDNAAAMKVNSTQSDYTTYGTWATVLIQSNGGASLDYGAFADGTDYYTTGNTPHDNGLTSGTYTYRGDSIGKLVAAFSDNVTAYGNYEADVVLRYNGTNDSISGCIGCNRAQFIDVQSNNAQAQQLWTANPELAVKIEFPSVRLDGN